MWEEGNPGAQRVPDTEAGQELGTERAKTHGRAEQSPGQATGPLSWCPPGNLGSARLCSLVLTAAWMVGLRCPLYHSIRGVVTQDCAHHQLRRYKKFNNIQNAFTKKTQNAC